jgi:hypothetical protein
MKRFWYKECERQERNIEVRLLDHCCLGKAMSVADSNTVCNLCYPACNAHAPYYTVICGLAASIIFFHIIS